MDSSHSFSFSLQQLKSLSHTRLRNSKANFIALNHGNFEALGHGNCIAIGLSTRWLCLIVTHKIEVEVFCQLLYSSPTSSNLPQFSRVSSSIATTKRRSFCLICLDSSMEENSVRFHVLFINCNVWFLGKFQVEYLNSPSFPLSPQTPKVPSLSLSTSSCVYANIQVIVSFLDGFVFCFKVYYKGWSS